MWGKADEIKTDIYVFNYSDSYLLFKNIFPVLQKLLLGKELC